MADEPASPPGRSLPGQGEHPATGAHAHQLPSPENPGKHSINLPADKPEQAIFSYYRDGMENVGGLKVKWTVRVLSGPAAASWDARQAEALREALEWIRKHPAP